MLSEHQVDIGASGQVFAPSCSDLSILVIITVMIRKKNLCLLGCLVEVSSWRQMYIFCLTKVVSRLLELGHWAMVRIAG